MSVLSETSQAFSPVGHSVTAWWSWLRFSWREARPAVQVMFQLRFLTAAVLTTGGLAASSTIELTPGRLAGIAVGAVAWLCVTWQIYLLNGVCDQTEDRCNGSQRPLASGALPLSSARQIAAALGLVAVGVAALHSWPMVVVVVAMLLMGWLYSAGPAPQKANMVGFVLVVSMGGGLTYLAGALAAGLLSAPEIPPGTRLPLLVLATAMSLWMSLAGTTKDLSDVDGDRVAGRRTLPVLLGDLLARRVMALLAIGVGTVLIGVAWVAVPVLLPAGLALGVGGWVVATYLASPGRGSGRATLRRPYRAFMVTQYTVHATVLAQCLL